VEYNLYRVGLAGLAAGTPPECEAKLGSGTSAILPTLADQSGFLVVGRNASGDGSFGSDDHGHERPSPLAGTACP
jgi:hypothetical protein